MDYFLCMPDISFSEEQCKALERIVKKLSEGNRLTYVGEAMEVAGKKMPAYLKKYRLNKMEEDFKIEDPELEGYLTRKEEERILAVCETEEEAELMKSCIYGYAYFRPSLIGGCGQKVGLNSMSGRMNHVFRRTISQSP